MSKGCPDALLARTMPPGAFIRAKLHVTALVGTGTGIDAKGPYVMSGT